MDFIKYEGLGNDFIVVEAQHGDAVSADRAKQLCDRHFGIGADGVLLVTPAQGASARAAMTVLNADGSRPEMCGNGLRCVALHLALADRAQQASYAIETDAGLRGCEVQQQGAVADVAIEMGAVQLLPGLTLQREQRAYEFHRVSTGNPHAVCFQGLELAAIDEFAPRVSAAIAGGANVEFVTQTGPAAFSVVVWERGVGRTLACGTGAVAVAAAAVATGQARLGSALSVRLPGGELEVTMRDPGLVASLRGPARRVFAGQW